MNPEFLFIPERVTGIEPVSLDWQPRVIAIILYPQKITSNNSIFKDKFHFFPLLIQNNQTKQI